MVKIIAKMDPREGCKLVGKWLFVQQSIANGDRQCELNLTQSDYRNPPLLGDAPEGMVRTVIDLPVPPVPYERIVWRKLKYQDWYLSALYNWEQCNNEAYCSDYKMLCLDLPAPKVTFPTSVPGFKKGTWFKKGLACWYALDCDLPSKDVYEKGTQVVRCFSAWDALMKIDVEAGSDDSLFQTQEDG